MIDSNSGKVFSGVFVLPFSALNGSCCVDVKLRWYFPLKLISDRQMNDNKVRHYATVQEALLLYRHITIAELIKSVLELNQITPLKYSIL